MSIIVIITIAILSILIIFFRNRKSSEPQPEVLQIQKTRTLSEMITSIDYGRVDPYYIGMSLTEIKDFVRKYYMSSDIIKFDKELQFYEMTNQSSLLCLPKGLNPYIDDIILCFNENDVIDSITIVINNYEKNETQLKELLCAKFGMHTPSNGRYITWKNLRMVIRVDEIDGCIDVTYVKF